MRNFDYNVSTQCPLGTDPQIIKRVRPFSNVLEIGCSTGYIGKYLGEELTCTIAGVEINEAEAEEARPYYDLIVKGDIQDKSVLDQIEFKYKALMPYDHILLMSVIEFWAEPLPTLQRLSKLLKPGGTMLISLPNIAHWSMRYNVLFGNFNYQYRGILERGHLRFYTAKTSRDLIESAGLRITHSSIDPDNGIPKFNGLMLRFGSSGVKFLSFLYNLAPKFFGYQFIYEAK